MEKRQPNTTCRKCEKPIYRRPGEIERYRRGVFCSRDCYHLMQWGHTPSSVIVKCLYCGEDFKRTHSSRRAKYCSRKCSNGARRGIRYSTGKKNSSQERLHLLKTTYGIECCMVEDCDYGTTLDVHRIVPGYRGGLYELGNMFAVCPNHHAEHTRGLIILEKISDTVLHARKADTVSCGGL